MARAASARRPAPSARSLSRAARRRSPRDVAPKGLEPPAPRPAGRCLIHKVAGPDAAPARRANLRRAWRQSITHRAAARGSGATSLADARDRKGALATSALQYARGASKSLTAGLAAGPQVFARPRRPPDRRDGARVVAPRLAGRGFCARARTALAGSSRFEPEYACLAVLAQMRSHCLQQLQPFCCRNQPGSLASCSEAWFRQGPLGYEPNTLTTAPLRSY